MSEPAFKLVNGVPQPLSPEDLLQRAVDMAAAAAREPEPRYVPVALVRERMEKRGTFSQLAEILVQQPEAMLKVLTLQQGIDPADLQARALIMAAGDDPDVILA